MASHDRMVYIAKIALYMLEEMAMKTQSSGTKAEIVKLRECLRAERISSSQNAMTPQRLKQYEDRIKGILNGQIDVSQIDTDGWWNSL
jgi:hypothetical protein